MNAPAPLDRPPYSIRAEMTDNGFAHIICTVHGVDHVRKVGFPYGYQSADLVERINGTRPTPEAGDAGPVDLEAAFRAGYDAGYDDGANRGSSFSSVTPADPDGAWEYYRLRASTPYTPDHKEI